MAWPLLTLVALAGVYLCVPETDQLKGVALLVVGVALVELVSSEALPFAWHAMVMVTVLVVTGDGEMLMGIGAVFGALNTMYSAVAARTREIATLRALGFGNGPVVLSVLGMLDVEYRSVSPLQGIGRLDTYAFTPAGDFLVGTTNNVPEPASLSLLGAGLFGLAFSRRRG